MPIRLLITCGLLAVACPASAQVHDYGHGAPVYDSHIAPYYDSHGYDEHSARAFHPHTYSHGYHSSRAPLGYQYGSAPTYQALGYADFDHGHGAPITHFDSCPESYECPFQSGLGYADSGQQYEQNGDRQFGSSQFHGGHVHDGRNTHDHGHAHEGPGSSLAPRGDVGRLQELPRNQGPFRDQLAPEMLVPVPSDRQPLAPPSLPPSSLSRPSRPDQLETPLGDGPPPNTVPLSSPQRSSERNAGPTAVNI